VAGATLDRDSKVTYGSLVIGGAASGTNYHFDGHFEMSLGYEAGSIEFDVIIAEASLAEATFVTREQALRDAFRLPEQRLLIELGSTTRHDFNPTAGASGNSGFNAVPSIRRLEDEVTTGRSSRYRCGVTWDMPADLSGRNGLQAVSVRVTLSESRRKFVTIAGTYTALTTNDATAQHDASISAYETSVLDAVIGAGTWQRLTAVTDRDITDKTISFVRTYEEIVAQEAVGVLDDTDLLNQQMSISAADQAGTPVSNTNAEPFLNLTAVYSVSVDKTSTTDLEAKWTDVIRPHLISEIGLVSGAGATLIDEATPTYDIPNNRISAVVRARVQRSSLVEEVTETRDQLQHGLMFVPLASGSQFEYARYQGPKNHIRTVSRRRFGSGVLPTGLGLSGDRITSIPAGSGFHVLDEDLRHTPMLFGLPGERVDLELVIEVVIMIRAVVIEGATAKGRPNADGIGPHGTTSERKR
jgi:hypothetical protein